MRNNELQGIRKHGLFSQVLALSSGFVRTMLQKDAVLGHAMTGIELPPAETLDQVFVTIHVAVHLALPLRGSFIQELEATKEQPWMSRHEDDVDASPGPMRIKPQCLPWPLPATVHILEAS